MNKMRLNKYLAACGVGSRRKIDSLAEEKKILVNGFLATLGQQVDDQDEIIVDGVKIESSPEKKIYFMLNKPLHVLSTAKDWRGRKSVVDLIDCPQRIFPVGRLDYDTTGLILLTNDGELAHKILHPRNEIYKEWN